MASLLSLIESLERLEKAATPGPWSYDFCGDVWSLRDLQECPNCLLKFSTQIGTTRKGPGELEARFMCEARNAIPQLLQCLKILHEACEKTAEVEIYFRSNGRMYDPSLKDYKTVFENETEILNPAREALKKCNSIIENSEGK